MYTKVFKKQSANLNLCEQPHQHHSWVRLRTDGRVRERICRHGVHIQTEHPDRRGERQSFRKSSKIARKERQEHVQRRVQEAEARTAKEGARRAREEGEGA